MLTSIQNEECCSLSDYIENFHIFRLDSAKTLSYVFVGGTKAVNATKIVIFHKLTSKQHPKGHRQKCNKEKNHI